MSQQALLARVVAALEATGVPYMATGSIVSSIQGETRSSHDIDIVVAIPPDGARRLLEALPPPDFYLDPVAVHHAVDRRDMFNLIEPATGEKVDFWPVTNDRTISRGSRGATSKTLRNSWASSSTSPDRRTRSFRSCDGQRFPEGVSGSSATRCGSLNFNGKHSTWST